MKSSLTMLTALLLASAPAAIAEDKAPEWLFVQTASGFTSDGTILTIPYEREIFAFTDRPNRLHAYLNAHEMASLWRTGENDFTQSPPNAVLTWVAGDQLNEAEIELTAASVDDFGRSIHYEITLLEGQPLPETGVWASIFIDDAGWDKKLADLINDVDMDKKRADVCADYEPNYLLDSPSLLDYRCL